MLRNPGLVGRIQSAPASLRDVPDAGGEDEVDEVRGGTEGGGRTGRQEGAVRPCEGEVTRPGVTMAHCHQSGDNTQ